MRSLAGDAHCWALVLLRSKRSMLWTSEPCWMPLRLQMFSVTASQSPANSVNAPWSWWAWLSLYLPATYDIHIAPVSQPLRANR